MIKKEVGEKLKSEISIFESIPGLDLKKFHQNHKKSDLDFDKVEGCLVLKNADLDLLKQ